MSEFDIWNEKKKEINELKVKKFFKSGEIWWCAMGKNIGSEENGKGETFARPVIIFREFGEDTLWAIPLTTKESSPDSRMAYKFVCDGIVGTAKLAQIRLISSKRLLRYIGNVSFKDFQNIRRLLIDLI